MARRIEVELTSSREDGTWTWRAAGARQPKGELDGSLLYEGAKPGDVVKVEADFNLDGIEITTVFPPKAERARPETLELKPRPLRDDELVTSTRAPRREGGRDDDRRRGPRREGGGRREGGRREGAPRSDQDRRPRRERPEVEARPKPKRLRPRRAHRDAVLGTVPEEYRPIAERVMSGGIPEVRKALEEQNAAAKADGGPEVAAGPILKIAEDLLPRLREAEWRDRADAALADLDEIDLRDLRSVVVAADAAAREDESRAAAEQLREGLNRRVEADHAQWMADLTAAVDEGRTVRALRLSSRPVKAGAPLPSELATRLVDQAAAALAPDISQDRWATVLDAVAFSPVRAAVTPAGIPSEPSPELLEAVKKVADRVPAIATQLGIDPAEASRSRTRRPRTRKPAGGGRSGGQAGERGAARPAPGAAEAAPPAVDPMVAPAGEAGAGAPGATTAPPEPTQAPVAEAPAVEGSVSPGTPAADSPSPADATDAPVGDETSAADGPAPDATAAAAEIAAEAPSDEAPAAEVDDEALAADAPAAEVADEAPAAEVAAEAPTDEAPPDEAPAAEVAAEAPTAEAPADEAPAAELAAEAPASAAEGPAPDATAAAAEVADGGPPATPDADPVGEAVSGTTAADEDEPTA